MPSTKNHNPSIAWVDLSTGNASLQSPDPELVRLFIGGRGLGAALLFQHLADPADPYAPENPLIFSTGALTGTSWPAGARYHITFHSPLTGIYGYANAGGFFGPTLRRAGYAALLITGRADRPVYLELTPEHISIHPAKTLWGRGTYETHDVLEVDGARVACIGPAGENGVRFAGIVSDRSRVAARSGGGAIMGSKNLKAVVVRAAKKTSLPTEFRAQVKRAVQLVRDHPASTTLRDWGTVSLISIKNHTGDLPARNHQFGQVPFVEKIDAEAIANYTRRNKGCFACPIRCGRVTVVEDGPYAGELEGPEYETLDALGPMCWIGDPELVMQANRLCDDFGLDSISTGTVIAFAMECHERGLLNSEDLSLEWGDPETLLGLIEQITHRRGLGDLLAEGVRRAAETIGGDATRYAMHVKGMELPRQEPRIAKGFGLGHATSNRGADHLYALPTMDLAGSEDAAARFFPLAIIPELLQPDNETYKPDLVVLGEHYCAVSDALGVCKFTTAETYALYPDDLAAGLSALSGQAFSGDDLLQAGERIVNLERLYNARLGLSSADDRLPARFDEPLEIYSYERDEASGEMSFSPEPVHTGIIHDFGAMLDRYYRLRGWDTNGIPTPETLKRLELDQWMNQSVRAR